jgi:hypothetical protein
VAPWARRTRDCSEEGDGEVLGRRWERRLGTVPAVRTARMMDISSMSSRADSGWPMFRLNTGISKDHLTAGAVMVADGADAAEDTTGAAWLRVHKLEKDRNLDMNQLLCWLLGSLVEMEGVELDESIGNEATESTDDERSGGGWMGKKDAGGKRREMKEGNSQTPGVGVVNSGSLGSIDGRTVTGISTEGVAACSWISRSGRVCSATDWSALGPSEGLRDSCARKSCICSTVGSSALAPWGSSCSWMTPSSTSGDSTFTLSSWTTAPEVVSSPSSCSGWGSSAGEGEGEVWRVAF